MPSRPALITGASRGIGRAIAKALSESGVRVALCARSTDQLEELAGEIRSAGCETFVAAIDMANADSIKQAATQVSKDFGRVTSL